VAGIGNLYASEILHVAGIHPARPCDRLRPAEWEVIHEAVRQILEQAVLCEGSTLSDGTYRNALNQSGEYQNHHRVYDKEDEVCPICRRGTIRRVVQAQRATFFCPVCQPRSARGVASKPR
jgi:formamidopyrimidine-DNA glycosylase